MAIQNWKQNCHAHNSSLKAQIFFWFHTFPLTFPFFSYIASSAITLLLKLGSNTNGNSTQKP